ncbi:MAG: Gfo/Idh/MocA family oxidoreductase [Planctomycetota bacterium]|jgi:hypothetical protein
MPDGTSRRGFLVSGAGSVGAVTVANRSVLGGAGRVAPNDKTTVALIGMGTQQFKEMEYLFADPRIQIVAVCDPNRQSNDYVDWGKYGIRNKIRQYLDNPTWGEGAYGVPGGRELGRHVVDTCYAKQRGNNGYKGCASYSDFRELLENEKDVDMVKVMTPDHLHATISIAAMKRGKNVVVHKPLANRMDEGRKVIQTARQTGVHTHFLPYNNSGVYMRRIHGLIKHGAIGKLKTIHNWSSRPMWPQYPSVPTDRPAIPEGFDWDLWLGPAMDRPYHPNYTHAVFRGWYEFGGGSLADMGHYSLWSVFTEFDLGSPTSAQAWSSHVCEVVDQVSKRKRNDVSFPMANMVRFKFGSEGDRSKPELYWYDGGMKPQMPEELDEDGQDLPREGMLFVGDKGKVLAGFRGDNPRIIPKRKMRAYLDGKTGEAEAYGRTDWLNAFRGGGRSPGDFINAGPITDAVNLGAVAIRTGKKIEFDAEQMHITNNRDANKYFHRDYRPGWEL